MSNKQIFAIIAILLAWFWFTVALIVWSFAKPEPVRYDCSLAEISPDIQLDVRKQCRKILS